MQNETTTTTQYYTKPAEVRATQWLGQTEFIDLIRTHFDCRSIDVERHIRVETLTNTIHLDPGDWITVDPTTNKAAFWCRESFEKRFFAVEKHTTIDAPQLTDLL